MRLGQIAAGALRSDLLVAFFQSADGWLCGLAVIRWRCPAPPSRAAIGTRDHHQDTPLERNAWRCRRNPPSCRFYTRSPSALGYSASSLSLPKGFSCIGVAERRGRTSSATDIHEFLRLLRSGSSVSGTECSPADNHDLSDVGLAAWRSIRRAIALPASELPIAPESVRGTSAKRCPTPGRVAERTPGAVTASFHRALFSPMPAPLRPRSAVPRRALN